MSKQSILVMIGSGGYSGQCWWWLQKDDRTNIGSHFMRYQWDTKKSTPKEELINDHGWTHVGGNSLVAWDDK